MIMTFDFIFAAQHDKILMKQLREAIQSGSDVEICTDIHRIHFDPHRKAVAIRPYSETSAFRHKIAPKEVSLEVELPNTDWCNIAGEASDMRAEESTKLL